EIATENHLFAREEEFAIRIFSHRAVVQRIHECIVIRHPAEAWRSKTTSHRDAVRKHDFNPELVEHPFRIFITLLLLHCLLCRCYFLYVLGLAIIPAVVPQRLPSRQILGIVRARHHVIGCRLDVLPHGSASYSSSLSPASS